VRVYRFFLLVLVLITFVDLAGAQQAGSPAGQNAGTQADAKDAPPVVPENWRDISDLKSGLKVWPPIVMQSDEEPDFKRELVRVQWRETDPIDLWVLRPKTAGKVPVVLYLYGYSDSSDRFHDNGWAKRVTAGGFAAVGFVSALSDYRFRFRPLRQWFVSELPESLGSSVHDVQLILDYLATRGDLDMDRVGMFGMGSGASIAILAAHADSRIKTIDLLDPWGDWPDWLKTSPVIPDNERAKYLSAEFLKSVSTLDPVTYLPSLKTQHLRLQQTLSEPVTPKIVKERIAAALPDPSELIQYTNAEDLLKAWKTAGLSGWIKEQMHVQAPASADAKGSVLSGVR
jgi:acetyl esterase/lipase